MKLDVLNIEGKSTGRSVELPEDIFGVEPNEHAVWLAVKQFRNNQRTGTHKAKERGEIKGSTRKIKKQKGTGTARAGDIKNPLFRGGGRIFGPRPRKYHIKLNKKVKSLARKSALSDKIANGDIIVIEDFTFDAPKSSQLGNVLNNLDMADAKTLLVTADYDKTLYLSSKNLKKSKVMNAKDLHTYAILNANKLVLSESSIKTIEETFGSK